MLYELLREPLELTLRGPDACLERARQIDASYRLLNRRDIGADQLLELKFASLYWRRNLLARLRDDPPSWLTSDHNTLVGIVDALNSRLPDGLVSSLSHAVDDTRVVDYLRARQGIPPARHAELEDLAGPGITLNIRANRDSPWPFERWKKDRAFGVYDFAGDGVNFRGLRFRPGDILLANVNIDGNGVYTALSDPTRFSSHAAVFVVLEDDQGRYPAVIETYEKGVRAVPLNVFVGEGFCAYVEVYRHRDLDGACGRAINEAALAMLERARGYNFDSAADDREYLSCCSVGRLLHADAGLEPATWKSRIEHPRIRSNLAKLGYGFFDFFAPVDYLLDHRFECVGWIDNQQFDDLLARELVEGYFRELFMTRTLSPRKFPLMGRVNRWAIGHIRRQSFLGRAIGRVEGFDHESLPKGPDQLLSVITIVEAQLGGAIKHARRWLRQLEHWPQCFSLSEFARRPDVRRRLRTTLDPAWLE